MKTIEIVVPDVLYKYRSWNDEYGRRIITHNEVFFASPRRFNDPFDCRIPPDLLSAPEEKVKQVLMQSSRRAYPNLNRWQRRTKVREGVKARRRKIRDPQFREDAREQMVEEMLNSFGVLSLSATSENLLLWSHYSDSHRGFCVGLNAHELRQTGEELFRHKGIRSALLPVAYMKDFPELKMPRTHVRTIGVLEDSLSAKSTDWTYEEEYRMVLMDAPDEVVTLPDEAFASVILGACMEEEHKNRIIEIVKEKGPANIQIFQARLSKNRFALDCEQVDS